MVPNELDVPNVKTDIRSLFKDQSQLEKTREFIIKNGRFFNVQNYGIYFKIFMLDSQI